jgi:uncharacterized protein YjiS (DUF1127 family)
MALLAIADILALLIALYGLRPLNASAAIVTFPVMTRQSATMQPWCALVVNRIRASLATAPIWFRRSETRRRLRQLDGRELADIGQTEAERQRECAKWFWQA